MTTPTQENVTKLYVAFFGRAPDQAGLNYWVTNSGLSLEGITQSFFDQQETKDKYGNVENAAFITAIYQNVLNRAPDETGLNYWVNELTSGNIKKDQMILAILNGAQNEDKTLLENKTSVGIYFAANNQDNAPDAFSVIKETGYTAESVTSVKQWIDGDIPDYATPSTYKLLDDVKVDYKLTGTAKDDVFMVKKFKSADITGGEGSDTVDFSKFPLTGNTGVNVNLSTGLGPNGMKLTTIENIRGTTGNDTLVGNSDANILVAAGGADTVDGGVGNDRLLFKTIEDIAKSTINGGQNDDVLEITTQTDIKVGLTTFDKVSDVEVLQIGYSKEATAAATTITLVDGADFNTIKEIRGTESKDKKGVATDDVIQSAGNLDVSGLKLTSIEELKSTAADKYIKVGAQTLTDVDKVTGHTGGTTDLWLDAKKGDVFDLTNVQFSKIDRIGQTAAVESTVIVNQSLINSMAANEGKDGFGALPADPVASGAPTNNFTLSTMKASGIGLDLSALQDGDTNFASIQFGTAHEVTVGNINDGAAGGTTNDLTALKTIVGSENNADLLRVKPNSGKAEIQDLSAVTITKVERLDFEEVGTLILKNINLSGAVTQISGDDDTCYLDKTLISAVGHTDADPNTTDVNGTVIDAHLETAKGGLNLSNVKLENIVGFGNGLAAGDATITVNSATTGLEGIKSLDLGSSQTIIAADGGLYDFSNVVRADDAEVSFDAATGAATLVDLAGEVDTFTGSAGNDIVKGGKVGFAYSLNAGDDQFIGTNTASELVQGGAGNDNIALGNNTEVNVIAADTRDSFIGSLLPYVVAAGDDAATRFTNWTGVLNAATAVTATTFDGATNTGAYADGGANDDAITSGTGNDVLIGGAGNDSVSGGVGNDILSAGVGDDILSGGAGIDFMLGGAGSDLLEGNAGEDFLVGGKGRDVLRGGELTSAGAVDYGARDHFIFNAGDSGETADTVDIIKDFLSSTRTVAGNTEGFATTQSDVLYVNWFGSALAGDSVAVASDDTGGGVVAVGTQGVAYGTQFVDLNGGFNISSADSLVAAANLALDKLYELKALNATLEATDYTSAAAQFEYGGKEYLVVDSYVTDAATLKDGQAANNYSATNDLIVEISDTVVNWSMSEDDIVVTQWNTSPL